MNMEKKETSKLNMWALLLTLAAFLAMCLTFLVAARYMLMKQYVSPSDGRIMASGGLWVSLMEKIAAASGMNILQFTHTVMPAVFLAVFFVVINLLGFSLFSKDKKGRLYTFLMTFIFVSIVMVILHVGYFKEGSLEAGVYINPWQGSVIAGMLLTPLIIITLLLETDNETKKPALTMGKWAALIALAITYLLVQGFDAWRLINKRGFDLNIIGRGWLFILTFLGCLIMIIWKRPAIKMLLIGSLNPVIFLVPIPLAILAAYSLTELIGEILKTEDKPDEDKSDEDKSDEDKKQPGNKQYILAGFLYLLLLGTVLSAGLFSKTRVSWNVTYTAIENKERLPQGVLDAMDSIEASDDTTIYTSSDIASVIKQKDVLEGRNGRKVYDLWTESPMTQRDSGELAEKLETVRDQEMYVIIKNVTAEDRNILNENKIFFIKDFSGYSLYRR